MTVTDERRAAPRFPLVLVAKMEVEESGSKAVARTSDVSRTGCYIDTLNPIKAGTMIRLRFEQGEDSFQTRAVVVYEVPSLGMGVHYVEPEESQLAVLDSWLSVAAAA